LKSKVVGGLFLFMTAVFGVDAFMFYKYIPSSGTNFLFLVHIGFAFICLAEGVSEFMGEDTAKVQR
jgi:hypothetical protein